MERCSTALATNRPADQQLTTCRNGLCSTYTVIMQDSWRRAPVWRRRKRWVLQIRDDSETASRSYRSARMRCNGLLRDDDCNNHNNNDDDDDNDNNSDNNNDTVNSFICRKLHPT